MTAARSSLRFALPFGVLALAAVLAGCRGGDRRAYAARVGDAVLAEQEVAAALSALPPGLDSAAARQQVVEQWVTAELLAQEARRHGLPAQAEVQRALAESERAVLGAALVEQFFEANPGAPTEEELAAYFAQHRERLALQEPYVRVRHLRARTAAAAAAARAALARAGSAPYADSIWALVVHEYADDEAGARALSASYVPESRLRAAGELLAEAAAGLDPGAASPVLPIGGAYHVLQLVDRRPAGTPPEMAWVHDELRERLAIDRRRGLLARQVQALRTEALAAGRLDVPRPATASR